MNSDRPGEHGKGVIEYISSAISKTLKRLPAPVRGHLVAVIGEFAGTTLFLGFAFAGTQVANVSSNYNGGETVITTTNQKSPQQLLYIALSFGFALAVNAWIFFRVSGGLFNPAVTLGMWMIGAIGIIRAILLFLTQIVGGIVAAAVVQGLFTGELAVGTDLSSTTTTAQGVLIEMILTLQLVFTIFMLAAEKHTGNFIAPVGIGLSLFIAELTGVFWTGGSLNPARSFGPAVITSFEETQWIYWVGPFAGAILAVLLFKLIKALEYETLNGNAEEDVELGPAPPGLTRTNTACTGECQLQAEKDANSDNASNDVKDFAADSPTTGSWHGRTASDATTVQGSPQPPHMGKMRGASRGAAEWDDLRGKTSQRTLVDRPPKTAEGDHHMRTVNEMV